MQFRELSVSGGWEITPKVLGDSRGAFLEAYKAEAFAGVVGHRLDLRQVNTSISAAGVVRGVHFADVPPSQAKYVTCVAGAVLDVVVDIRVGSATFGGWDTVLLDDVDRRAVYLSEGLGHAFFSLDDGSVVQYLCSAEYAPARERGVHPLDTRLAIDWPTHDRHGRPVTPLLSPKDEQAPTLDESLAAGVLPRYDESLAYIAGLDRSGGTR